MSKKTLFTLLQYLVFFGLAFGLIWWQYRRLSPADLEQISVAFEQVKGRMWLLFPITIVGFLSHLFRALRWKLLLAPLHLRPSTFNITGAVLIGYLVNLLLPRMGEVARCTVLARYEKEPADKIIGTIVAERSFDLVCLILVSMLAFAIQVDVVRGYVGALLAKLSEKSGALLGALGILAGLVILLVFIYRKGKNSKIGGFIAGIGSGISAIWKMQRRGLFLLYTLLIWTCYLGLIYIGFLSMDATMVLDLKAALSVLVFGSLGMIVTPGGLGAYPIAVQEVLTQLYAVAPAMGLAFGWVSWLVQTLLILVLGLLSLLFLPMYNRESLIANRE